MQTNDLILKAAEGFAKGLNLTDVIELIANLSNFEKDNDFLRAAIVVEVARATSFLPPIPRDELKKLFENKALLKIKIPDVPVLHPLSLPKVEEVDEKTCWCLNFLPFYKK